MKWNSHSHSYTYCHRDGFTIDYRLPVCFHSVYFMRFIHWLLFLWSLWVSQTFSLSISWRKQLSTHINVLTLNSCTHSIIHVIFKSHLSFERLKRLKHSKCLLSSNLSIMHGYNRKLSICTTYSTHSIPNHRLISIAFENLFQAQRCTASPKWKSIKINSKLEESNVKRQPYHTH